MGNTVFIIVFWILILFPILYVIKIKDWNIKTAALFVGRVLLRHCLFHKWNDVTTATKLGRTSL
ncbi:hypothetical protein SAMN04487919_102431 [Bacillus sp. ok061]|nr:hypothetical protein SAMN04487919_102431 [Bacillus sp. ok061]